MQQITKFEQIEELSKNSVLIVDFGASWCGPCRAMNPIFDEASRNYPNITFAKCDADESPEILQKLNISTIPCLKFFKNGVEEESSSGLIQLNALESKINNFLND